MVLIIPILGGLIAGAARRLLPGAARTVGRAILGSGARKAAKTAIVTGGGAVASGGIKRVLGTGAAIAGGAAVERMVTTAGTGKGGVPGAAPIMVGGVNINPFATTPRRKYRKMNPLNPRALTRSIKRVTKFGEFARQMGYSRPPSCLKGFKGAPKRRRKSCR